MCASEVISSLQRRGVTLKIVADSLKIGGVNQLTNREKATLRAHKASILKALAADSTVSTSPASPVPIAASLAVTEALPTCTEPPEPEPKDRLCCECQHFAKSSYGYPLGLCVEHGSRVQHRTSEPTRFGCGSFEPKEVRS